METQEQQKVFLELGKTLLGPVVAALIGAIGIWLRQWYQTRDARYKLQQARLEAAERVDLIEKWLRVKQQACSPEEFENVKRMASQQLEQIYTAMFEARESVSAAEKSYFQRIRRALLLFRPASFGGWIIHLIFYLITTIALVFIAMAFTDLFKNAIEVGVFITLLIGFSIIFLVPAALVRAWAIRIDKKNRRTVPTQ